MLFLSEWVNKSVVKLRKIMRRLSCIKSFAGGRLLITDLGTFMELGFVENGKECLWVGECELLWIERGYL